MEQKYNMKSPAVKRLMREAKELCEPSEEYFAHPVEDNLFEWHFTVRGPTDSDFEGGIYHGRIILPPEYPMKPPSIILLTPNGRFEVNKKICLSISGHHPESWQPSWSIRTALLAIIGFMPTQGLGAIGSLDYQPEERRTLAQKSHDWKCQVCGPVRNLLINPGTKPRKVNQEALDLVAQISFKGEAERSPEASSLKKNDIPSESQNTSNGDIVERGVTTTVVPTACSLNNTRNPEVVTNNAEANVPEVTTHQLRHRGQHRNDPNNTENTLHGMQTVITVNNSRNSISTLLIAVLVTAIMALIFRRLFLL